MSVLPNQLIYPTILTYTPCLCRSTPWCKSQFCKENYSNALNSITSERHLSHISASPSHHHLSSLSDSHADIQGLSNLSPSITLFFPGQWVSVSSSSHNIWQHISSCSQCLYIPWAPVLPQQCLTSPAQQMFRMLFTATIRPSLLDEDLPYEL